MRILGLPIAAALMVAPAMVIPTDSAEAQRQWREWQGRDGRTYCRRSDGTTGLVVGGVAGALVGRTIDTRGDRTIGTVAGAAAGALLGREVERGTSRRRCR